MNLNSNAYSSGLIFCKELESIFPFRFVVPRIATSLLYAFPVSEPSYVLTCDSQGVSLLRNICLHRANFIAKPGISFSNSLRCSYHGQCFAPSGLTVGLPIAISDSFSSGKCAPVLKSFVAHDFLGLVFGSLSASVGLSAPSYSQTFKHQLHQILEKIGFSLGSYLHSDQLLHRANWKLLVENVVESLHVDSLHSDSFVKRGVSSRSPIECHDHGIGTLHLIRNQKGKVVYSHAYVYPNLFISVTSGAIVYIAWFHPVSPDETLLEYCIFSTASVPKNPNIIKVLAEQAQTFTKTVLLEDLPIVEACHKSLRSISAEQGSPYLLTDAEVRIKQFHSWYLNSLANEI